MLKNWKRLALGRRASTKEPIPSEFTDQSPGQVQTHTHVEAAATTSVTETVISCETCGPLTTSSEEPVLTKVIFKSADAGCSICLLFSKVCLSNEDQSSIDYVSSWSGSKGVFGVYLIEKIIEDGNEHPGRTVAVVVLAADSERSPSPFSWLPNVEKSPFNRSQLRDTKILSSWITDCQENHTSCRQEDLPKLPTRIIDVGSGTVEPFLKVTQDETGRYLALSHRWGDSISQVKMLVTQSETFHDFCRAIPLESFPLTFKHAIEVTRSLGIQYLWIDSLCIVQDDLQDWEIEAARMGDTYENAYATLFAESAAHCNEGLFQTKEDKKSTEHWVQEIEYGDSLTNDHCWILASSQHSYYPNLLTPQEAFCLVDKSTSHLQNRGWIMQEEILSRRKICFSSTELHWQCTLMSQCECGLKSLAESRFTDSDLTRNLLYTNRGDGSVTRGLSASNSLRRLAGKTTNLNTSWRKLVEMYSTRAFTHDKDRLAALAGVASKLGRPPENYWAGIWREDASDQLLWRGWNRPEAECKRHDTPCAPTWSWASIRGGVTFCYFGTDSRHNKSLPIWRILGGVCLRWTKTAMGPIPMGALRIQSKAAKVFVDECEGPAPNIESAAQLLSHEHRGILQHARDGQLYHLTMRSQRTAHDDYSNQSVISLDAEADWEPFAGKTAQELLYLVAHVGSATGAAMSKNTYRSMGLLIRESTTYLGSWERVCLVAPRGWWGEWRGLAEDCEILLR
ncbi:hypothetical protein VTL71DRAFT_2221 [Oculimacula yallundae]|uniref:Heterokaryon incompatibility domain-containing protein n=1 Tax=Oculimacula yallundae TaxID=86028 RepID=A0ABR4C8B0_9HELO